MPVIRLNSVVLPAPFGPMMALRSPGWILNVTLRVACRPPKLLHSPLSSSTGISPPFAWVSVLTRASNVLKICRGSWGAPGGFTLLAELAGREVAIIDRLRQEPVLSVGPELTDLRIGLDYGVPELVLVVTEHLLLLDLLDVDVLDRVAVFVELDRSTWRIE